MPWKDTSVPEERFRFIEDWRSGSWDLASLCRSYGVTRKTGYKWIERYQVDGLGGLRDLSRAPHHHPNAISPEMEDRLIAVREKYPLWGARKIRAWLEREEPEAEVPAVSTIGAILKQNGLTVPRKRRRSARPSSEPLAHARGIEPGLVRGLQGMVPDRGRHAHRSVDHHATPTAATCCAARRSGRPTRAHAKPVFEAAFREYGLPERIRTDNGAPFGSNGESGLTGLTVWWIKLGIQPERIQPGKPQQNGRHERMHRTLKQATASPPAANRRRQQQRFDEFRREYNEQRPHEALGQVPPAVLYECSSRPFPVRLPAVEYPQSWQVRRVS